MREGIELVLRNGFEPSLSTLRGWFPSLLEDRSIDEFFARHRRTTREVISLVDSIPNTFNFSDVRNVVCPVSYALTYSAFQTVAFTRLA
jgi:hypothetical protein